MIIHKIIAKIFFKRITYEDGYIKIATFRFYHTPLWLSLILYDFIINDDDIYYEGV